MEQILHEIQINKTKKRVYALDENYEVYANFIIGTDFYAGYNENGQPYSNVDDGVYDLNRVDIDYPKTENQTAAYGWAYINIDIERGRALHGGGANLGYIGALEPIQSQLCATLGCFRMRNVDVFWLAHHAEFARDNGVNVVIHVVS